MGIGEDNAFLVETDDVGRMIPADLERKIQEQILQNGVPIAVVATSGWLMNLYILYCPTKHTALHC